jgi:uncharacterized membrane protein YuzA (DUF378 family)
MLASLIDGIFGAIGILVAVGLLILLAAFLFGTTVGRVLLVLMGLAGLFALFCWIGKRVEKRGRQERDWSSSD